MRLGSNSNLYTVGGQTKKSGGHYVAAVCCAVLIVFAIVVFFIEKDITERTDSILPTFTNAIEEGDYSKALSTYRKVQDVVVSADPEDAEDYVDEVALLDTMESIVREKVDGICLRVRQERYEPSPSDVKFLNDMQELTSSIVNDWLNELCKEFLLGKIEKPDIIFVFNQMSPISNFAATTAPLLKDIDTIEMATGDVQTAERAFNSENYIDAVHIYQDVEERYNGFVHDYTVNRLSEIMDIMYEPMIEDGEHMLDTYKFYSAEKLLSSLSAIFPDDDRIRADLLRATSHTTATVEYRGKVEVICIRALIADKSIAFDDNYVGSSSDQFLTCDEFEAILQELYNRNYCLVDAEGLAGIENTTYMVEQNLRVPENKKPLILVVENLCYSASNYRDGVCTRLVLNDQGEVCGEYYNAEGEAVVSRTAESIGILDNFIDSHPDFTYDGAKGVISVSGYESCFGYVVSDDEIDDRNSALGTAGYPTINLSSSEIQANRNTVQMIADVLKDTGWKFASSTYGYINAHDASMETIMSDTEKWMSQIGSLLTDTHMIVYPNGDYIYGTDERAVYLKNNGFRIFFGIGSRPYYTYGDNYLYYDRAILNGRTLRNIDYSRLFDVKDVYDEERPTPLSP